MQSKKHWKKKKKMTIVICTVSHRESEAEESMKSNPSSQLSISLTMKAFSFSLQHKSSAWLYQRANSSTGQQPPSYSWKTYPVHRRHHASIQELLKKLVNPLKMFLSFQYLSSYKRLKSDTWELRRWLRKMIWVVTFRHFTAEQYIPQKLHWGFRAWHSFGPIRSEQYYSIPQCISLLISVMIQNKPKSQSSVTASVKLSAFPLHVAFK